MHGFPVFSFGHGCVCATLSSCCALSCGKATRDSEAPRNTKLCHAASSDEISSLFHLYNAEASDPSLRKISTTFFQGRPCFGENQLRKYLSGRMLSRWVGLPHAYTKYRFSRGIGASDIYIKSAVFPPPCCFNYLVLKCFHRLVSKMTTQMTFKLSYEVVFPAAYHSVQTCMGRLPIRSSNQATVTFRQCHLVRMKCNGRLVFQS